MRISSDLEVSFSIPINADWSKARKNRHSFVDRGGLSARKPFDGGAGTIQRKPSGDPYRWCC
jgi:hypothetical protein